MYHIAWYAVVAKLGRFYTQLFGAVPLCRMRVAVLLVIEMLCSRMMPAGAGSGETTSEITSNNSSASFAHPLPLRRLPTMKFACNTSGPENSSQLAEDLRYTMLIFEFRQAMDVKPWDDAEHALQQQAAAVAASAPAGTVPPPVFVYRNINLGSMFKLQRPVMKDPTKAAWFLSNASVDPTLNITWRPLDFTNAEASRFFTGTVVAEVAAEDGVGGLFLDNADAHLCGGSNLHHGNGGTVAVPTTTTTTTTTTNASQLWRPTLQAYRDACTLLAAHGKGCILSIANAIAAVSRGGHGPDPSCVHPEEDLVTAMASLKP